MTFPFDVYLYCFFSYKFDFLPSPCVLLTDKLIDDVVDGTSDQLGKHSISALERYRDDCLLAVLEAVKTTKAKHGMTFAE